jgi:hypothetical protein
MNNFRFLAALLLTLPLAAAAQTTPTTTKPTTPATTTAPATQQQTEVTEDLDPATGKVIRRTTRTINVPVGTTAPVNSGTSLSTEDAVVTAATNAQVSAFLRKKTTVATLTAPALLSAYDTFIQRVRNDRHTWKSADWSAAAAILSSLNSRYDQLRSSFSLDDKLTIRSQQGEFQALRTARQISNEISDKL